MWREQRAQVVPVLRMPERPVTVISVTGMPGTGKTCFLRDLFQYAVAHGVQAQWLDCRAERPPFADIRSFLTPGTGERSHAVLFVDHADACAEWALQLARLLDDGLDALPGHPARVTSGPGPSIASPRRVLVVAHRTWHPGPAHGPHAASQRWLTCQLGVWTAAEAETAARHLSPSLDPVRVRLLHRWTGGHPGAFVCALGSPLVPQRSVAATFRPVVRGFVEELVAVRTGEARGGPSHEPTAVSALFALAFLDTAHQDELSEAVGEPLSWQDFDALTRLSTVTAGPDGAHLHPAVARLLRQDLHWCAPIQARRLLQHAVLTAARRASPAHLVPRPNPGRTGTSAAPVSPAAAVRWLAHALTLLMEFWGLDDETTSTVWTEPLQGFTKEHWAAGELPMELNRLLSATELAWANEILASPGSGVRVWRDSERRLAAASLWAPMGQVSTFAGRQGVSRAALSDRADRDGETMVIPLPVATENAGEPEGDLEVTWIADALVEALQSGQTLYFRPTEAWPTWASTLLGPGVEGPDGETTAYRFDGCIDLSSWLRAVLGTAPDESNRISTEERALDPSRADAPPDEMALPRLDAGGFQPTEADVRELLKHLNHFGFLEEFVKERGVPGSVQAVRDQLVGLLITDQVEPPLTAEQQRLLRLTYLDRSGTAISIAQRMAMSRTTYYRVLADAHRHFAEVYLRRWT